MIYQVVGSVVTHFSEVYAASIFRGQDATHIHIM
jgi:hypothetical protein